MHGGQRFCPFSGAKRVYKIFFCQRLRIQEEEEERGRFSYGDRVKRASTMGATPPAQPAPASPWCLACPGARDGSNVRAV